MIKKSSKESGKLEPKDPIVQIADRIVGSVKELIRVVKTEEDLRIGFEKILEPLLKSIGIQSNPKYEHSTICRGRTDALHGRVIIEYESPGVFSSKRAVIHAEKQLLDYMAAEAKAPKADTMRLLGRLVGVGFDGISLFFVQYPRSRNGKTVSPEKAVFSRYGPYPFDPKTVRTFLVYLRALARLPLTAENLAEKFGPKSSIASLSVSAFADALKNGGNERVHVFLEEWKRLFGIVYGEQFGAHQAEEVQALSRLYGMADGMNLQELLFSVHTYFAFLMKLIAAEIITLKESSFTTSYSHQLTHT